MVSAGRRIGGLCLCIAAIVMGLALGAPTALADWAVSGAMTSSVASQTNPFGFAFDGGEAVVYFEASADGVIHELGYVPSSGWSQGAALTSTGIAAGTVPTGFDYGGGAVRVYFVAAGDGTIHQLSYNPSTGWAETGAMTPAVAAGTSPTSFVYGTNGAARVYFVAASDGAIHELGYNPSSGWTVSGALTSPVAPGTSPVGFASANGGAQIYFVAAADHQIHQVAWDNATGWTQSAALTSGGVAAGSTPVAFLYGTSGSVRLYYVGAGDGAIHGLAYDPGSGWAVSGALTQPVMAGTRPTGFVIGDSGVRIYFVAASDEAIHQLSWESSTGWSQSVAMAAPVQPGTSPTSFPWTSCDQRIYFVAAVDDAIHELGYNGPNQTECLSDLEPAETFAPVGTAPATIAPPPKPGHVHVKITLSWHWQGTDTTLRAIRFIKLPRTASIAITCAGRGCPRHRWSSRPRRSARLVKALRGCRFRAGDRLRLAITVPGLVSERAQVRFRNNHKPLAKVM